MSIDKNTNEGKNYRNNVVKSTPGTSKSRINTGFPEDISVLSPMMREYCKTKESYKDCILFYRLGEFYFTAWVIFMRWFLMMRCLYPKNWN